MYYTIPIAGARPNLAYFWAHSAFTTALSRCTIHTTRGILNISISYLAVKLAFTVRQFLGLYYVLYVLCVLYVLYRIIVKNLLYVPASVYYVLYVLYVLYVSYRISVLSILD